MRESGLKASPVSVTFIALPCYVRLSKEYVACASEANEQLDE